MYTQEAIDLLIQEQPILRSVIGLEPITWINLHKQEMNDLPIFSLQKEDMLEASKLWDRFASYFELAFPETASTGGIAYTEDERNLCTRLRNR